MLSARSWHVLAHNLKPPSVDKHKADLVLPQKGCAHGVSRALKVLCSLKSRPSRWSAISQWCHAQSRAQSDNNMRSWSSAHSLSTHNISFFASLHSHFFYLLFSLIHFMCAFKWYCLSLCTIKLFIHRKYSVETYGIAFYDFRNETPKINEMPFGQRHRQKGKFVM